MTPSIAHFTTVHARTDTRIRVKEAPALAKALDAEVFLFVQDGKGDEFDPASGLNILDTGPRPKNRLSRMTMGSFRMYRAIREKRPAIAHFHDPELISVGLALKLSGTKVIYDVHEDLPRQILAKGYLSSPVRNILSRLASAVEWLAGKCMDRIVLAGATIQDRFPPEKSLCVYNYPMLEEFSKPLDGGKRNNSKQFVYVGSISSTRGAIEMIRSIDRVKDSNAKLYLAGPVQPLVLESQMAKEPGWKRTQYVSWLSRNDMPKIFNGSVAGLVTLNPTDSYLRSYPTKLFEYMTAGLPVIASDFPFWRDMLSGIDCAIFVDPMDPQAIADAMQWILDHPDEAKTMGERGRAAINDRFNWSVEANNLVDMYRDLLSIEK